MSLFFASPGENIGASASVLPVNSQGWFPLGLTGLISLLFNGFSEVFSSTTIWKHQFFSTQHSLLYGPSLTSVYDYWRNHSFDCSDLCYYLFSFQYFQFASGIGVLLLWLLCLYLFSLKSEFSFLVFLFYWSSVDLQCRASFWCIAEWFSYTRIYILFNILFHYG